MEEEVGHDKGAAGSMKNHHFIEPGKATEALVLDRLSPAWVLVIVDDGVKPEVRTFLGQTGSGQGLGIWKPLQPLSSEEVMVAIRA